MLETMAEGKMVWEESEGVSGQRRDALRIRSRPSSEHDGGFFEQSSQRARDGGLNQELSSRKQP